MTNSTRNGKQPEMVKLHSHCIAFCGWLDCEGDHGDYCERLDIANGVTGPGWARPEFWCSVIHPYIRGTVSTEHAARCEDNRNGVQLTVNVDGEVTPTRTYEGARWQELEFNLTPAEARQLAAQLVAAADNHDGVGQDRHIMHRLGKFAKNLGADIFGA